MDNEQIAHDLAILIVDKMLKDDNIKISLNPAITSTDVFEKYSLHKNNILSELNHLTK